MVRGRGQISLCEALNRLCTKKDCKLRWQQCANLIFIAVSCIFTEEHLMHTQCHRKSLTAPFGENDDLRATGTHCQSIVLNYPKCVTFLYNLNR